MALKAYDIVGYTYKAENYRPEALIEMMIAEGSASPAARAMTAEEALDQIAAANAIDRQDEWTFDSGEFPKVIFASMLTEDDHWYYLDED